MDTSKLMALMKSKKAALQQRGKTVKPTAGTSRWRILPGWKKGEEHVWFHDFGQHFVKNAADEIQAVYICTDATYGKPCDVCSGLAHAVKNSTDQDTVDLLGKAKASRSVLLNALALGGEDPNTPVILEIKNSAFVQLVSIVEEWGADVFDSEKGKEIIIERTGKGLLTKYAVSISNKGSPIPAAVYGKLNNLDEYVAQESEEIARKTLSAIRTVAGLAAIGTGADKPLTPATTAIAAPKAAAIPLSSELDDLVAELEAEAA